MTVPHQSNEEIEELLAILQKTDEPMTLDALCKKAGQRLSKKRIEQVLDHLVGERRVYRLKPARGAAHLYSLRSPEDYAREVVIPRTLAGKPLTRADLEKKIKSKLRDLSEDRRKSLVGGLLKEGAVHEWPPLIGGRSKLLSTRQAEARFYIEEALTKIRKKLGLSQDQLIEGMQSLLPLPDRSQGAPEPAPVRQPIPHDLSQIVVDRMVRIKPAAATGALVSLTELRRALKDEIPEKDIFDQTVFRLAEDGRVALHQHDFPASLSRTELDDLVTDGRGNYYVGVAFRL